MLKTMTRVRNTWAEDWGDIESTNGSLLVPSLLSKHLFLTPGKSKLFFSSDPSAHCSAFLPPLQAFGKGAVCFCPHPSAELLWQKSPGISTGLCVGEFPGWLFHYILQYHHPSPPDLVSLSLAVLSPPQATLYWLLPKMPVLPRLLLIPSSLLTQHTLPKLPHPLQWLPPPSWG